MPAHVTGKHRGGEKHIPMEQIQLPEKENDSPQFSPSGRIKRKAASMANKKVMQAFKEIDSSVNGEDGTIDKDIPGVDDGDNADDEEYNLATDLDYENVRKMYLDTHKSKKVRTRIGKFRFSCLRCKFKSKVRSDMEDHVVQIHSTEAVKSINEDEEDEAFDDNLLEEEMDIDGVDNNDDDFYEDYKKTPSKRSKHTNTKFNFSKDSSTKAPPLHHDKDMIKDEIKFRERNFCVKETLFSELRTTKHDWIRLNSEEMEEYLEKSNDTSICFKVDKMTEDKTGHSLDSDMKQLKYFDSYIDVDSCTFYTGGPIWASDWCPLTSSSVINIDVLALSVDMDFQTETKLATGMEQHLNTNQEIKSNNSLLQLWSCDLQGMSSARNENVCKPKMQIGITHDFGKIWCLKWCPSGCEDLDESKNQVHEDKFLPRLGLLAAACSDGSIRIFSIPQLSALVSEKEDCIALYKARYTSILTLCHSGITLDDGAANPACLSLSWFRGDGHRVVAGAYADGNVAIWNLETKSVLLRTQPSVNIGIKLYPYMFFRAHLTGVKISLDFGTESLETLNDDSGMEDDTDEDRFFPRYLVTGSSDRVFAVWDLADGVTAGSMGSIVPIRQFRRHLIRYTKKEVTKFYS